MDGQVAYVNGIIGKLKWETLKNGSPAIFKDCTAGENQETSQIGVRMWLFKNRLMSNDERAGIRMEVSNKPSTAGICIVTQVVPG